MSVIGYSDRINHALAFAAKHHDRQVHKGTRAPYRTNAANVGVILTRYGQPDETVIAGILYDVVEDAVRERQTREMLDERVARKFGDDIVETLLSITTRLVDDSGLEFTHDERRADLLDRLGTAGPAGRWVFAAVQLHESGSTLADLRRTIDPESVWSRVAAGRDGTIAWLRRVHDRLAAVGFQEPIMSELATTIDAIDTVGVD